MPGSEIFQLKKLKSFQSQAENGYDIYHFI
jgi:hypothetical protein